MRPPGARAGVAASMRLETFSMLVPSRWPFPGTCPGGFSACSRDARVGCIKNIACKKANLQLLFPQGLTFLKIRGQDCAGDS